MGWSGQEDGMDVMKEIIQKEIQSISSLEERVIFKNLMEGVFLSLYDTNREMYEGLERRIKEELDYDKNRYYVKTGIVEREFFDASHHLLSPMDESWVGDSISHRLESAKQRYFDTVGQKMQTKAAPIREGVIVIKQETTMQELQQFATVCKERFGIEAFQIHIHKDEGYMNAKQWTPNLHAHIVFDWTQPNGKSVRLSRDDMATLQTIASEALGMERGVSSDRKHLSAMQYKTECAKEQLQELSNDISSALDKHKDVQNQLLRLQKELRSIETKKNVQKLISKASEKFYGLIGKTVNDREKDALKAKIKALEGENEQLSDRLGKAILEKERNGTKVFKAENDKEYYRQQMDNARTTSNRLRTENQELKTETKELKKELGKMKDLFDSEQLNALKHRFPNISNAMNEGKELLKQNTPKLGGRGI